MKTIKEVHEFFNKVKDKKIKLRLWHLGDYFIPKALVIYNELKLSTMHGIEFDHKTNEFKQREYFVGRGFGTGSSLYDWIFTEYRTIDNTDKRQQDGICTCPIQDLMLRGCKCGGK